MTRKNENEEEKQKPEEVILVTNEQLINSKLDKILELLSDNK